MSNRFILIAAATVVGAFHLPTAALAQATESVVVQKVMSDSALILRSDGSIYLIEKGVGCLSLGRYEGRKVAITSPGLFLGIGSKLVIEDLRQECRIWDSKLVDVQRSGAQRATEPPIRVQPAEAESALFDSRGTAVAYLDAGDVIFLWTGEPVAYLTEESVYGFNGKHIGWYRNGIVYDHDGDVVAAPASAFRTPVAPPPPRSLKQLKPLKGLKELKPLKPLFGTSWSSLSARVFLLLGSS